jgi:4-alpha-glucanotransferase
LQHLYWVPQGNSPADGAYVQYPFDDLAGILALESWRNRCLVIGEDLGTVPAGFREKLIEGSILSYRVVYFEQDPDSAEFIAPDRYPALALATIGSHDLATLKGWWTMEDVAIHERHGLYPDPAEGRRQRDRRTKEKAGLLAALRQQQLDPGSGEDFQQLSQAVHAFLARSSAAIAMVQMVNLTGEVAQVNLPATTTEHPNWRRRLSMTLEEIRVSPEIAAVVELVRRERPSSTA